MNMSKENEIYDIAFELYLTTEREKCRQLVESGAFVNYREFNREQFEAACKDSNTWAHKTLIKYYEKANEQSR